MRVFWVVVAGAAEEMAAAVPEGIGEVVEVVLDAAEVTEAGAEVEAEVTEFDVVTLPVVTVVPEAILCMADVGSSALSPISRHHRKITANQPTSFVCRN